MRLFVYLARVPSPSASNSTLNTAPVRPNVQAPVRFRLITYSYHMVSYLTFRHYVAETRPPCGWAGRLTVDAPLTAHRLDSF